MNFNRSLPKNIRLGVNIDHVATIRNARGGHHPDPLRAAKLALEAGADSITVHLREDRRHINEKDVEKISKISDCRLNLEIAVTEEMIEIAGLFKPKSCCLVPERRQELTTEGGLQVAKNKEILLQKIKILKSFGIKISIFIDPENSQIKASKEVGADAIELHTGLYCNLLNKGKKELSELELKKLSLAASYSFSLGMGVHAGHGINYESVKKIAKIKEVEELNIGHFIIGESIFEGFKKSIIKMRKLINNSRNTNILYERSK